MCFTTLVSANKFSKNVLSTQSAIVPYVIIAYCSCVPTKFVTLRFPLSAQALY